MKNEKLTNLQQRNIPGYIFENRDTVNQVELNN